MRVQQEIMHKSQTKDSNSSCYNICCTSSTPDINTLEGAQDNIWEIKVLVEGKLIIFKVDTGAEVTVISEKPWKSLQLDKPLQNPNTFLCGPDHT